MKQTVLCYELFVEFVLSEANGSNFIHRSAIHYELALPITLSIFVSCRFLIS